MYLISIYFDEETNKRIQRYIDVVAEKTGNTFMTAGHVPPHITVSAFEIREEKNVKEILKERFSTLPKGKLTWCSVGTFFPYVIYLAPVLNEYANEISKEIYECLSSVGEVEISKFYRPFQWMPHTTIGKKLSKEEMNFVQIPGKPEVICHDYELMLEDGAEKWWSGNVTEM